MCQKCKEDFEEFWPELDARGRHNFLWSCTNFPFGKQEDIRARLIELISKHGKNLELHILVTDQEMDEEHKRCQQLTSG